jgi:ABC-type Fe3+ transport system permease subunit
MVGILTGAISTFLVLVFSAWTTFIVARARRRTRAVHSSGSESEPAGRRWHRWLLIRVLAFSACVAAAFVTGIVQLIVGFSAGACTHFCIIQVGSREILM